MYAFSYCLHFLLFFSISGHIVVAHNKINEWIKREKNGFNKKRRIDCSSLFSFLSLFYLTISDKYNGKEKRNKMVYYETGSGGSFLGSVRLNVLLCTYPIHSSCVLTTLFFLNLSTTGNRANISLIHGSMCRIKGSIQVFNPFGSFFSIFVLQATIYIPRRQTERAKRCKTDKTACSDRFLYSSRIAFLKICFKIMRLIKNR